MNQPDRETANTAKPAEQKPAHLDIFLEKSAQLALAINRAQEESMSAATSAEKFRQNPSPQTLTAFTTPLAKPDGLPELSHAQQVAREARRAWTDNALADKTVQEGKTLSSWDFEAPRYLKEKIESLEEEKRELTRNRITAAKNFKKIRHISKQLQAAQRHLDLYQSHVAPSEKQIDSLRNSVVQSANRVAEFVLHDLPDRLKKSEPSNLVQTLEKENVQDQLEAAWIDKAVKKPLQRLADVMVIRRRREQDGYGEIDEHMDRASFALLVDDYAHYVESEIKRRSDPEYKPNDMEANNDPFENRFEELGLLHDYWKVVGSITFQLSTNSQTADRWRSESFFTPGDSQPKNAYPLWAKVIEASRQTRKEWQVPEPERQLDYDLASALRNIGYNLDSALRNARLRGVKQITIDELTNFPAMDRFLVLKDFLIENGLYPKEDLEDIETTIIVRLLNEALIPGGAESWPGTDAAYTLDRLGSPKALDPLLYFQTLVSGARGLYSAGHTNAVVQGVLENILRRTQQENIDTLGLPEFVRESLSLLRDLADDPMGDNYGRSYLTAATVAGRASQALAEIQKHPQDPSYEKWTRAILSGMKNSSQAYSKETYDQIVALLETEGSRHFQDEIVEMLALRIHNREQLGITTRINPDFPVALETFVNLMDSPNFDRSPHNMEATHHVIRQLQTAVHLSHWTGAELTKLKLFYASVFQTNIGVPDLEQMDLSHHYKEEIANRLKRWMADPDLSKISRYLIIQIFKSADINYPGFLTEIESLFKDNQLASQANDRESWRNFERTNFLDETNSHGYYECLTNLLLEPYFEKDDQKARDSIITAFTNIPQAREGILNYFMKYDPYEPTPEQQTKIGSIFDDFNNLLLETDDPEMAKSIVNFLNERSYIRHDQHAAQLLIADVEKVTGEKQRLVFKTLIGLVRNFERVVGKEIPSDLSDGGAAIRLMQDTAKAISEKMWQFLDSDDLGEQFWAVYTLNLYNESGEKFREVVDRLLQSTHDLEILVPNSTQLLDKIKERIKKQDKPQ